MTTRRRITEEPNTRIALLERQLEAKEREIRALTHRRDIALRVAAWGGRRREPEGDHE